MTDERDLERRLRTWMRSDGPAGADRLADHVARRTTHMPQRSGTGWYVRRAAAIAASAAVILLIVAGIGAVARWGATRDTGADGTSARTLTAASGPLAPGHYTLAEFPVRLTFEVPSGFHACVQAPTEQGVCRGDLNIGVSFVIVDNLVADPCAAGPPPAEPPIGPTVDDLVAGLRALPRFTSGAPAVVDVDGLPAQHLTLVAPNVSGACARSGRSLMTWIVTPTRINGVAVSERNELWVLEAQGERLMIALATQPDTPPEAIAELRDIVESVRFDG